MEDAKNLTILVASVYDDCLLLLAALFKAAYLYGLWKRVCFGAFFFSFSL